MADAVTGSALITGSIVRHWRRLCRPPGRAPERTLILVARRRERLQELAADPPPERRGGQSRRSSQIWPILSDLAALAATIRTRVGD